MLTSRLKCRATNLLAIAVATVVVTGCGRQSKEVGSSESSVIKTASGMTMVFIPGGEFKMGVDEGPIDVKPAHQVKVDGFLMDRQEMTQEIYEKIIGKNPSRRKNPKNPVEQVTWSAAVKFCNARSIHEGFTPCYNLETWECNFAVNGYRLPTEAEWEYACRAGTTTRFYCGDRPEELRSYAWFEGNSDSKSHPVAQRKPNPWGLYDMAGNVWEWCNDLYGAKYYRTSPVDNPHGPQQGEKRLLRGGAWSSGADNCASWVRNCEEAGVTDVCLTMDSNGFRCVRRQ